MKWQLTIVVIMVVVSGGLCLAGLLADLNSDGIVDYEDFALMASQWLNIDPCIPADMIYIPGGEFEMGDSFGDGLPQELPVHTVTIDSFYMTRCEITNKQYCDFLNTAQVKVVDGVVYSVSDSTDSYPYCDTSTSGSYSQIAYSGGVFSVRTKSGRDMSNDPMVEVSWYGAVAYCNWRSQQESKEQCYNLSSWACDFGKHGYRLATEAEWEYAARGGLAGRRFPWGDTVSHSQANYYSYWEEGAPYYPYDVSPTEGYHPIWNDGVFPYTSPGGSFTANGYGLYDMAGNVWEWCNDWYSNSYYSSSPYYNPTGPSTGSSRRVVRGGAWIHYASACRVAFRNHDEPAYRSYHNGFRVVLDLTPDRDDMGMVWISINDPGVPGHEGFNGYMSKYETTNAQYCQFLNAALASGDITVSGNAVIGASGSNSGADFVGEVYYDLDGMGYTEFGATNGGAARINYSDGVFGVDSGFENHPVTYVSWYGATAFCNFYGYRLPTEWEWEAVADFNESYDYGCGASIDPTKANYADSTHPDGTTAVCTFGVYGYGMADMAGNVWEWTSLTYDGSYRIIRGGCWASSSFLCGVSALSSSPQDSPSLTHGGVGFRVVSNPNGGSEPELVAFHVDGIIGDDGNDGLTHETAFETIQKGINTAEDGNIVLVWPGIYVGQIYFYGKAITLKSADYPAVIEAPWQDAVSFIVNEGAGSVLSNFVIRDSMTAIACNNQSSPTLKNLTIVDNAFGIAAYENSRPNISNCILWRNQYGDLYGCEAQYSCIETGRAGVGNISTDPLFADIDGGNYHLLSENGRYIPAYGLWSFDDVATSPCVDAGDPADDFSAERRPNGSRVNMGAYGGTPYASMGDWAKTAPAATSFSKNSMNSLDSGAEYRFIERDRIGNCVRPT